MSFVHASIVMDADKISKMMGSGLITNNASHQRASLDWNKDIKTKAISSGIMDIPFPPLYAKKDSVNGKDYYRLIDGGHRCETFRSYINNEWSLGKIGDVTFFNEVSGEYETANVSGKLFVELQREVQDKILNTSFTVIFFDNLTTAEELELFRRLNSGKPLSAKEKTVASTADIDVALRIGNNKIFSDMFTTKAIIKKMHVGLIMKIWCMLNIKIGNLAFDTKTFSSVISEANITKEDEKRIGNILNYAYNIHKSLLSSGKDDVAKKMYTETHFISLVPFFDDSIKNKRSADDFAKWVADFYGASGETSINNTYNIACGSGVAKGINIMARHQALQSSYDNTFA